MAVILYNTQKREGVHNERKGSKHWHMDSSYCHIHWFILQHIPAGGEANRKRQGFCLDYVHRKLALGCH